MFIDYDHKKRSHFTLGDDNRGKIFDEGIETNPSTIIIDEILLVKRLKLSILSVTQSCDKGYLINFYILSFLIEHKLDKKLVFKGSRVENIYMLSLDDVLNSGIKCIVTKNKDT